MQVPVAGYELSDGGVNGVIDASITSSDSLVPIEWFPKSTDRTLIALISLSEMSTSQRAKLSSGG